MFESEHSLDLTDKFWNKSLHNLKFTRLLGIIAASNQPISESQITNRMKKEFYPGSNERYVYEMIKELCPITDPMGELLFCWTHFSRRDANRMIKKLKVQLEEYFEWGQKVQYNVEPTGANKEAVGKITLQDESRINKLELTVQKGTVWKQDDIKVLVTSKNRTWQLPTVTIRKHGELFVYATGVAEKSDILTLT